MINGHLEVVFLQLDILMASSHEPALRSPSAGTLKPLEGLKKLDSAGSSNVPSFRSLLAGVPGVTRVISHILKYCQHSAFTRNRLQEREGGEIPIIQWKREKMIAVVSVVAWLARVRFPIRVNILFTNEYCEERRTLTSKQRCKWRSQYVNPAGRVGFDILTHSIYLISRKMEKTNIFSYFLENWIEKNCVHNALNTEDRERIKV